MAAELELPEIEISPVEERFFEKKTELAARIAAILDKKQMKRKALAEGMGILEQSLSRMLSGTGANLTLMTVCEMENALGEDLLQTPQHFRYALLQKPAECYGLHQEAMRRRYGIKNENPYEEEITKSTKRPHFKAIPEAQDGNYINKDQPF